MQQTNKPDKIVIPFANSGARNKIPSASQIGVTAGRASLTDGFPPLTRTPISAGGVPPSGLDMNGILYEISAVARWANAGGGYAYDSSFATDPGVNGYPKGARVMRSDGTGYWLNTVDNNASDPEGDGAAAAGWVPDFTNGVASIAMSGSTVTLTPSQYGKPIIVITGALTSNLSLIFPSIVSEWTVINTTTGPYTITCKTSGGTGVVVNANALIFGDGTNIQSAVTDSASIFGGTIALSTGGTSDAITATFSPAPKYATPGIPLSIRASVANTTSAPTFTPNAGVIAAKPIVKLNNLPLAAGDIAGGGHWIELQYDATLDSWVLLNPANGIAESAGMVIYSASISPPTGYLKANGAAVSRSAYSSLFAAIGTTFGAGDGSTTFNLPDLRGEFVRGWDDGKGIDSGRALGGWQADDFKSHKHTTYYAENHAVLSYPNGYESTGHRGPAVGSDNDNPWPYTSNTGGTETRPRNVALLACIKY